MSADHYISRDPCGIYHTKGKSDPSDIFQGGRVFTYHSNVYVRIKNQVALNATETFNSKLTFYREAQIQGMVIKGYHNYNAIFNASESLEELLEKQKNIKFNGAGASHKNGSAERTIKTVVTMAITTLMHNVLIFPEDTFTTDIWPMAMDYAVWVYNRIPDMQSGLSAI